jgi:WD40 repeat protein
MLATSSLAESRLVIHLWDLEARRLVASLRGHRGGLHQFAFSPDGQTLASSSWDGKIGLWNLRRRLNLQMLSGHTDETYGVAFSPDGLTVASCGTDAVRLWNVATFRQIASLETGGTISGVAFSPDGRWLAASANGGTVQLWQAPQITENEARSEANTTTP